jgi:hypothetical protein
LTTKEKDLIMKATKGSKEAENGDDAKKAETPKNDTKLVE